MPRATWVDLLKDAAVQAIPAALNMLPHLIPSRPNSNHKVIVRLKKYRDELERLRKDNVAPERQAQLLEQITQDVDLLA